MIFGPITACKICMYRDGELFLRWLKCYFYVWYIGASQVVNRNDENKRTVYAETFRHRKPLGIILVS